MNSNDETLEKLAENSAYDTIKYDADMHWQEI